MDCIDDLPVHVLLTLLSFLHDDLAIKLLSTKDRVNYGRNRATIRDLATVSKSWASAIEAVEGHFREKVLVFDFQKVPDDNKREQHVNKSEEDNKQAILATEVPSGGIFHLVWGLLSAFSCSSNDRLPQRIPEENESRESVRSKGKEMQAIYKVQNVKNELNRLLDKVMAGKPSRLRIELWLNDPFDVTIYDFDDKRGDEIVLHWGDIFSNFQHLVQLNLSGVPMESDHLPAILNGVGKDCANLEVLVMPQQTHLTHRRQSVHHVLEAFHAALIALDTLPRARSGSRSSLKKLVLRGYSRMKMSMKQLKLLVSTVQTLNTLKEYGLLRFQDGDGLRVLK